MHRHHRHHVTAAGAISTSAVPGGWVTPTYRNDRLMNDRNSCAVCGSRGRPHQDGGQHQHRPHQQEPGRHVVPRHHPGGGQHDRRAEQRDHEVVADALAVGDVGQRQTDQQGGRAECPDACGSAPRILPDRHRGEQADWGHDGHCRTVSVPAARRRRKGGTVPAGRTPHPVRKRILITGASSGLGAGMARLFAARGRDLALTARRTDRLDDLRAELEDPSRASGW